MKIDQILNLILECAISNSQILAVGYCGSWVRGTAKPDSDIV
jgi:predicted nucleotidyltransferase